MLILLNRRASVYLCKLLAQDLKFLAFLLAGRPGDLEFPQRLAEHLNHRGGFVETVKEDAEGHLDMGVLGLGSLRILLDQVCGISPLHNLLGNMKERNNLVLLWKLRDLMEGGQEDLGHGGLVWSRRKGEGLKEVREALGRPWVVLGGGGKVQHDQVSQHVGIIGCPQEEPLGESLYSNRLNFRILVMQKRLRAGNKLIRRLERRRG